MKKKQLLALLMAGTLSVGMLPAAAYAEAAAEGAAVVQEVDQEGEAPAAEEPSPVQEAPAEEPVQQEAPVVETVPEQEAPVETPTEAPVETTPEEQPVDPAPTADPAPAEQSADDTAALADVFEEAEVTDDKTTEEEATSAYTIKIVGKDGGQIGEDYTSLEAAVAAASKVENPIKAEVTQILVTGTVPVDKTIEIGADKSISIAAGEAGTKIERAPGFTGDMFSVTGGGAFQFGKGVDDSGSVYDLTVDGAAAGSETGSIVYVNTGSYFGMSDGVTLTGSLTSCAGSAIRNEGGSLGLSGGTITNNQSSLEAEEENGGGAVYSTGEVRLAGNIRITGNSNDGNNESSDLSRGNVVLNGENAKIIVVGVLGETADVTFAVHGETAGRTVLSPAAGTDGQKMELAAVMEKVRFAALGSFTIGANGELVSTVTETPPTVTPEKPTDKPEEPPVVEEKKMVLTGKSAAWVPTDRTAAVVKFSGDKDGFYYVTWGKRGDPAPVYDESLAVNPMYAGQEVSVTVSNLDENSSINIYVFAKDTKNVAAEAHKIFQLRDSDRPEKEVSVTPTVTTRAPYTPKVSESVVKGLEQPLAFYPGKTYSFSVIGAGTDNTDPVKGDVQWRPLYWSSYSKPTSSQRQSIGTIGHKSGISRAATFNMYIFFQKYVYDGNQWQPTDVVESYTYKFQSKAITFTVSPSGTVTPSITSAAGYGGGSGSGYGGYGNDDDDDDYDDPETRDDNGADTGATSTSSNADTADNSPVATMMMLASLSLLTGGYVLVRRRKKA